MFNQISKKLLACGIIIFTTFVVSACSGIKSQGNYDDTAQKKRVREYGSIASDEGGFTLFGGDAASSSGGDSRLSVNGYLWRAALETIGFMPIATTDTFGGIITTDWYSEPKTPDSRARLNVFIVDRELRSDGVRVTLFRQTRNAKGEWIDAAVDSSTATRIEDAILTKARQMRVRQTEKDAK